MGLNRQLRAETRLSVYFILFLATGTGGFGGEVGAIVDLLSKSTCADNESTTNGAFGREVGAIVDLLSKSTCADNESTTNSAFGGEVGAIVDLLSKSTRADNESTTKRVLIKKKGFSFSADVLY